MTDQLNVLVICGSLRKGSYNAALTRALPGLAPSEMKLITAPSIEIAAALQLRHPGSIGLSEAGRRSSGGHSRC